LTIFWSVQRVAGRPDFMGGQSLTLTGHDRHEGKRLHRRQNRSSITAGIEIPQALLYVILAQGGAHSGWSLYAEDGKPAFAYNFSARLRPSHPTSACPRAGHRDLDLSMKGQARAGHRNPTVNGSRSHRSKLERTIPFIYGTETADVGEDLCKCDDGLCKDENSFTGTIKKATVNVVA
jgi:arylsulfatase